MKIRCRSIIALWGRRRVLSVAGEVSILLADAHTAISHLLNDMSFCGVMNTHKSQRSLRKLPDNAQIKILAGKNPARTTDILKGGDMIDKMIEKTDECHDKYADVYYEEFRYILLSAKPEWDAMVKRVEELEKAIVAIQRECDPECTWQEVIQDHKKYRELLKSDTIRIPRAVAEEYIEWINGGGWAFEDGVENLRNAIKKSLGR